MKTNITKFFVRATEKVHREPKDTANICVKSTLVPATLETNEISAQFQVPFVDTTR